MTDPSADNATPFEVVVIGSTPEETVEPKNRILEALRREQYPEETVFGVKLALEEALCNALKHGNECCPEKKITVRYAVSAEQVEVIVRDEGAGFDPDSVPDPTTQERLPLPTGRGILLMRAYMDEVEFRDDGREVYFRKRRPKS
ncbi:MAG: ATP-binding protein [Planctomycetota bacterium]|nr:MAG: ATP-binding protein [Planctomycetota bacterium]